MATKYEELVEPRLDEIKKWSEEGATIKEIAEALGVSYSGLRAYRKKYPALDGALLCSSLIPNMEALGSFFKRVTGYEYEEVTREPGADGKLVVTKKVKKFIPPDVEAGKFWLKNRMPEDFKDKHDLQHSMIEEEQSKLDDLVRQMVGEEVE